MPNTCGKIRESFFSEHLILMADSTKGDQCSRPKKNILITYNPPQKDFEYLLDTLNYIEA